MILAAQVVECEQLNVAAHGPIGSRSQFWLWTVDVVILSSLPPLERRFDLRLRLPAVWKLYPAVPAGRHCGADLSGVERKARTSNPAHQPKDLDGATSAPIPHGDSVRDSRRGTEDLA